MAGDWIKIVAVPLIIGAMGAAMSTYVTVKVFEYRFDVIERDVLRMTATAAQATENSAQNREQQIAIDNIHRRLSYLERKINGRVSD